MRDSHHRNDPARVEVQRVGERNRNKSGELPLMRWRFSR